MEENLKLGPSKQGLYSGGDTISSWTNNCGLNSIPKSGSNEGTHSENNSPQSDSISSPGVPAARNKGGLFSKASELGAEGSRKGKSTKRGAYRGKRSHLNRMGGGFCFKDLVLQNSKKPLGVQKKKAYKEGTKRVPT